GGAARRWHPRRRPGRWSGWRRRPRSGRWGSAPATRARPKPAADGTPSPAALPDPGGSPAAGSATPPAAARHRLPPLPLNDPTPFRPLAQTSSPPETHSALSHAHSMMAANTDSGEMGPATDDVS